ncbi:MAG: lipocalin-like domain-containing protein [Bacteroidaceae bacterium]|nr:lipocalin-like domain-containing protein [Bacteroidaceae bacterium]
MKKLIYIALPLFFLTACELEITDNGALGGNWQLQRIDTLATGGTYDMANSYIYWGIENNLLQVRDIDNRNLRIFFRFNKQKDSLSISEPFFAKTKDDLQALTNDSLLKPLGIGDTQVTYFIERLNNNALILKDNELRLTFRKY